MATYEGREANTQTSQFIKDRLDPQTLKTFRDNISAQLNSPSLVVSPDVWVTQEVEPETSAAFKGISRIADSLGNTERYKGVGTALVGGEGTENGLTFISDSMPQAALERAQAEMVTEINGILESVQSPHSL